MVGFQALAAEIFGVSATEIKIGNTVPYSGPASAYSSVGKADAAFFQWLNDQGGIAGRKINFISLDDAYTPPRTVEQTRRLVEDDQVAFVFNALGTPTNSAVHRYLNQKKVPQLFVSTGADKWADPQHFPWTIGYLPSYRIEAQIYLKYMLKENPNTKLAVLYQNDDFGKDYLSGLRDALGTEWDKYVVKIASYEVTDPTVDSPANRVARIRRRYAAGSGRAEICRTSDPQSVRYGLEAHVLHDQRFHPGRVGSATCGSRESHRHDIGSVLQGRNLTWPGIATPGCSITGPLWRRYLPSADISDGFYVWGIRGQLSAVEGAGAMRRRFLTRKRDEASNQREKIRSARSPPRHPGEYLSN